MSSPAPSVGMRKSQSRSPRRSHQSSPKRRPLHERSDSETNASNSPILDSTKGQDEHEVLKVDPFPRLPSQILSPQQRPYIFEDETATSTAVVPDRPIPTPKTTSPRRGRSNSPTSSNKGPRLTHASRLPRLSAPPVLKPSVSVSSTFSSLRSQAPSVKHLKEKYEGLKIAPALEERPSRRQLYSPTLSETHVDLFPVPEPVPDLVPDAETRPAAETPTTRPEPVSQVESEDADDTIIVGGTSNELDSKLPIEVPLEEEEEEEVKNQLGPEQPTEAQINLAKILQDAHRARIKRSPSVDSIRTQREVLQAVEKSRIRRSPSVDSLKTPRKAKGKASDEDLDSTLEPPKSATTPVAATDALLRALIESGENIQYPQLRKPSATSMRTDASSLRRAYPPPLRLRRKRAYSDISAELSTIEPSPTTASTPTATATPEGAYPIRHQPSYQSFQSRISFGSSSVHAPAPLRISNLTYHDTWEEEELDDTVSELQPQALRRQRSGYYTASISDLSRPASASSMRSSRVAFYHFLNDSRTAWARFYYRGEGRLRSVTPPIVTEVTPPHTPRESSIFRRVSSKRSRRSDSPASAGFPESLYVPRLRPLQSELEEEEEGDITIISDGTSLVVLPPHTSSYDAEDVVVEEDIPRPAPAYLPDIPYLSPSKRRSEQHEPGWIAPSMDESCGVLTRVNRQIALFCLGFVFPFAWMFASFLALPACPDWRSNTPNFDTFYDEGRGGAIQTLHGLMTAELYGSYELRRFKKARWWRRANRYMSLVGVCIIIIVIIASTVTATT